jgi:RNA polymerase sigma-70 factor (ECF subfamily)
MGLYGHGLTVQALVEAHYTALYRYAYRLAGAAAEAEDLTQEAFSKAFAKLGQLRDPSRAKPWLFSILRNAYLHRRRERKRAHEVSLNDVGDVPEPDNGRPLSDVEPEQLQAVLNDLAEDFRTPLILFYFEDFSYRDIAEQMDVPLGTVMSRLARAKGYLRARLTGAETAPEGDIHGRRSAP